MVSSLPDTERHSVREIEQRHPVLSARNLNNSRQGNHLTYSDQNLPVDSKRRLDDNINMRDHIREQNICARHYDSSIDPPIKVDSTGRLENDLVNLSLAQQEENAAVEELQRITSRLPQYTPYENNSKLADCKDAQSNGSVKSNPSSRQSRLERTCQNQSFNLFENEYPKQKQTYLELGSQSEGSAQGQRVPMSYNNLFRESPDFILATRGLFENEQGSNTLNKVQISPTPAVQFGENISIIETNKGGENNVFHKDEKNDIKNECRVLRLDKDFKYVGSQEGHNYFTEKHSKIDD